MTPVTIILLAFVFVETYIIITTNKIDLFRLFQRVEKNHKIACDVEEEVGRLKDSVQKNDEHYLNIVDTLSIVLQRLIEKNNWIIDVLKPSKKAFKKNIKELKHENEEYQHAKKVLDEFLEKYQEQNQE